MTRLKARARRPLPLCVFDRAGVRMPAKPLHASPTSPQTDISAARQGAGMLGLPLTPQGERVARLLEARRGEGVRYDECVIQTPRRSAKTTSVWSVLIGRAMTRPGYRCVTTAQSGTIASSILLEVGSILEGRGYRDDGSLRLYRNGGREKIEFANGSRIWVVPPESGAVRSAAADDIVIDEAGEHEGDKGVDFLNGVRPLQDTRGPLAQLVVMGTPGKTRTGMFWDLLREGRGRGNRDLGILDYSARDDDDPDDERVWRRVHPGIGTLTTMATIRKRRSRMDVISFAREYLCVWPTDASTGALDVTRWGEGSLGAMPERPGRLVLAFDAPKEQTCCAVVAAWRDGQGRAVAELLAFRPGVSWAARFVHKVAREAKAPVVFDEIGGNVTIAAELRRMRPSVQVHPLNLKQVGGSAQLLANEVREGRIAHGDQPDLTAAVEAVAWRPAGREGRAFGRRPGFGEISPAVAASFALWHYDQQPARPSLKMAYAAS